jgi:hypothetical protein
MGAFVVIGLPSLVKFENPWIVPIGTGILLLVVLLRTPGGLASLVQRIRGALVEALDGMSTTPPPAAPPVRS